MHILCAYTLTVVDVYMPMQQKGEAAHGGGNQSLLITKYKVLRAAGGRLPASFI